MTATCKLNFRPNMPPTPLFWPPATNKTVIILLLFWNVGMDPSAHDVKTTKLSGILVKNLLKPAVPMRFSLHSCMVYLCNSSKLYTMLEPFAGWSYNALPPPLTCRCMCRYCCMNTPQPYLGRPVTRQAYPVPSNRIVQQEWQLTGHELRITLKSRWVYNLCVLHPNLSAPWLSSP